MTRRAGDRAEAPASRIVENRLVSEPVWQLMLQLAARRRAGNLPDSRMGYRLDAQGQLQQCAADAQAAALFTDDNGQFIPGPALTASEQDFAALYCPLLAATAERPVIVGHLGQSLDSRIATLEGDSFYVTGTMNLQHLHRMRALSDAIIVGAETAVTDNPRLTTRLVEGPNPVRVVLDPAARLECPLNLLDDNSAPTILVHAKGARIMHQHPETIHIDSEPGDMSLTAIRAALVGKGLHAIFVEGGGVTVSRWLNDGVLNRLQLACAPMLVGHGRPAIQIPASIAMSDAFRPPYRLYQMGEDLLYDFDLSGKMESNRSDSATSRFRRLM